MGIHYSYLLREPRELPFRGATEPSQTKRIFLPGRSALKAFRFTQ